MCDGGHFLFLLCHTKNHWESTSHLIDKFLKLDNFNTFKFKPYFEKSSEKSAETRLIKNVGSIIPVNQFQTLL